MSELIIYGKPTCPHTKRALQAFPEAMFVDVLASAENMNTMLSLSEGQRRVPVIVRDGKAEIGYRGGS